MPILCDKTIVEATVKMTQARKLDALKPWADDVDMATGVITWNAAAMTALRNAIVSCVQANDAILTAQGGDIKKALLNGFFPIDVGSDGMPNLHTVRQVLYVFGGGVVKANAGRVPHEAFVQAFNDLFDAGQFKRVTPRRTVS